MSDNYLRIVPLDMFFVPPPPTSEAAVKLIGLKLSEADEIKAESYGFPVFIDQGANIETITCPSCNAVLAFSEEESIRSWWYEVADTLENENVAHLMVRMICCDATIPFPELTFFWPAGVASFAISIRNPGIANGLPPDLISTLETLLSCKLKQIWAHY